VEISKDGGKTWEQLARYDEEHDPVQYFDASFDITAYATSSVIVRWRFASDSGYESKHSWHIDNVQIADGATTYLYDDGGDTGPVVLLPKEHPLAWQRLHYDYNPNRFMPADNWYQEDNTTIFNGTLNLLKWAGLTVKIRIRVSTDGWNRLGLASGPGFYFDDVQIVGFGKPAVDLEFLGVSNLLAAAVDKPLNAKAFIANAGRDTLSGSITWYGSIKNEAGVKVATVAGRKDVTGFRPGTCIGIETTEALRWVPKEAGDYSMTAYLVYRGDEYAANDTTSVDFVVLGPPFAEAIYGEDFEGGALTLADFGFTVVNKGGDAQGNNENTWVWPDAWIYGAAPGISGYFTYENMAEKLDETLISPPIDISGVGKHNTLYLLHYIYFRPGHASLPAPWGTQFTDLTIEYTVNGGTTWTRIFYWADNDTLPGDYNRWPQTRLGIPYTTKTTLDLSDAVGNQTLQLRWRVTSQNSYVFGISIDEILLYAGIGRPKITSVTDVPKDQGKQVRVSWNASFNDLTLYGESGEEHVVTHYGLWRAIPAGASDQATNGETVKKVSNKKEMLASAAEARPGDRFLLASGGGWDFIATILAHQDPSYNYVAPTLWDSVMTTFMVSAHTDDPMIFVDSKPLAGMSIDNLAPGAPVHVAATSYNNVITVTWEAPPDPDVHFYSVYRSKQKGVYPPQPIARTGNLFFQETPTEKGVTYYYAISATDYGWNESPKSEAASVVTSVGDDHANAAPTEFALFQNYPNPFNPVTTIKYQLPEAAHVSLKIYNIYGQEITTLVDGHQEAGYFTIAWDAKEVASGVYFYELKAGSFVKTMKMILMK
ncbi:MAG: T9SS type A sorting domain-containing protein, partial [candidate division KSB1 bacterium]|nr:T9SS type A sorting domain-containing protein [candidate division KSB1 bacterium]